MRWNLKEVGWQTSDLTDRNHIKGKAYRVRLQNKLKPNSYPKICGVNVADRWRERLCTLTGEVCVERSAWRCISLRSNLCWQAKLNTQKSVRVVVSEKSVKTDGEKDSTVAIAQTQSTKETKIAVARKRLLI